MRVDLSVDKDIFSVVEMIKAMTESNDPAKITGKKTAMSLKFVTMTEGTDGLYSRTLEKKCSTGEETFPLEDSRIWSG